MSIVSVQSFRRGTGKTTIAANVAAMLAWHGQRVGVVDFNFAAPGLHILFNLSEDELLHTLNDFVWGECEIETAVYDLSERLALRGQLLLVPASTQPRQIARVLRGGYYVNLLSDACNVLLDRFQLDFLLLDTAAGLTEDTQLAMAIADHVLTVLRPDQQDYLGTGLIIDVARRLDVPQAKLIVNEVPAAFAEKNVQREVEQAYGCVVTAVLPHTEQLTLMGSSGIFALTYPDHDLTARLQRIAATLML
ncbi:MAG: MinD/ParA family protein [Chloroflexota bacterium]|nr:MinD/ParA family protein [Anaerolineales bacterium]MCA9975725.1 MinD/ParA family protein [Anaerolineales bacterium]MCB8966909.1 MinD/ParA family protein [Ardenticatenaceae bacterium]